jgi:hypothetical protein
MNLSDLHNQWVVLLELRGTRGGAGRRRTCGTVVADAVEYCRVLSGRLGDRCYMVRGDPAAQAALHAARIVF